MHWINSIAWKYFFSQKKDRFTNLTSKIAITATSFAISMLIVAFAVIRGFEETVMQKVLQDQGHIIIYGNGPYNPQTVIKKLPKHFKYIPMLETNCMVLENSRNETALLKAMPASYIAQFSNKSLTNKKTPQIIIGYKLAQNLNLNISDRVILTLPMQATPPFGIVLENVEFEIADIVKFNLHDLNRYGIVMQLEEGQKILNLKNKVHKVICFDKDHKQALKQIRALEEALPNHFIYSWKNLNMMFADIMRVQRNMVSIILFAIILLAAIACCVSLMLFVFIKKREIGVLRMLGATSGNIISIFLRVGVMISLVSTFLGTSLGLVLCYFLDDLRKGVEYIFQVKLFDAEIYLLPALPVSINLFDLLLILSVNFFIMLFAIIIPAKKSAKITIEELA